MGFCVNGTDLGSHQPRSGIPGNIGILRCKAVVWEHDPFLARPHQIFGFPFTAKMQEQMREPAHEMQFGLGSAFLQPTFRLHDMFICTENKGKRFANPSLATRNEITTVNEELDIVGSEASGNGKAAWSRLPGGKVYECDGAGITGSQIPDQCYETVVVPPPAGSTGPGQTQKIAVIDSTTGKSIFPHQLWVHIGNLFDPLVYRHPSEYNDQDLKALIDKRKTTGQADSDVNDLIESSAVWDYVLNTSNGKPAIWPQQTTKQKKLPVHWTIEKYTPVWQGEDFIFNFKIEDSTTDDAKDPTPQNTDETLTPRDAYYSYLMYNPDPKFLPGGKVDVNTDTSAWVDGISNEAFYISPQAEEGIDKVTQSKIDMRARYNWKYKTYLLIELGPNNPNHRYFIELVKGRNPRFLHLGEEWDHPQRLTNGVNAENIDEFKYIVKCRELDTYKDISCDELFAKREISFSIRNHLGRLVITFQGYEGQPWVINRRDNDPRSIAFRKQLVPMVIPNDLIRIHGGNISGQINWSPMEYFGSSTAKFFDRQVDSFGVQDKDIYMTCSVSGASLKYIQHKDKIRSLFSDPRWKTDRIGYTCDSYVNSEIIKNKPTDVNVYEIYSSQWQLYGKGFVYAPPGKADGNAPSPTFKVDRDPNTGLTRNARVTNKMRGVKPHSIMIWNLRENGKKFKIGLTEEADSSYPYKDYVSKWDIGVTLKAGTVRMDPPTGKRRAVDSTVSEKQVDFINYVTPIIQNWRLIVLGGGKPIYDNINNNTIEPLDIAPLIVSLSDSWSAENLSSMNHEMQVKCYIPQGYPMGYPEEVRKDPLLYNDNLGKTDREIYHLGQSLLSLHDKSFYITVSYWWDIGVGMREAPGNIFSTTDLPENNPTLIQMTGVAYGAQLDLSANKLYMTFQVKDYMSILKNQLIFNSPFFDAVQDVQAVMELARMAGFDDNPNPQQGIDRRPLGYLQKVIDDTEGTSSTSQGRTALLNDSTFYYNGEKSRCERYDLPGSYADLAEPAVRFNNGDTFESAIKRIAELSGKCIYFDRWGVLRLESLPAIMAAFSTNNSGLKFKPIMDFVTSPFPLANAGQQGSTDDEFVFDPSKHAAHLVWNSIKYQRSVEDCVDQIVLLSASNDIKLPDGSLQGGFLVEGYTFYEQIWDPTTEGFLGYRKPFYQSNGVFGGLEQIRNGLQHYARMKYPPITMSFETFGVPGLKALDIISLDGNLMYIKEISHELDPATNRWWMNVSGEWLKPFTGSLGFLKDRGATDSGAGPSSGGQSSGDPQGPGQDTGGGGDAGE